MLTAIKHKADEITSLWLLAIPVALMWPQSIFSHPDAWWIPWITFCFNFTAWSCLTLVYHLSQALNYDFGHYLQKVSGGIYLTVLSWVLILLAISPSTLIEHTYPNVRAFSLVLLNVWFGSKTWNLFKNQGKPIPEPWKSGFELALHGFPILAPIYVWACPDNKKMILCYSSDLRQLGREWRIEGKGLLPRLWNSGSEQLSFLKGMLVEKMEGSLPRYFKDK